MVISISVSSFVFPENFQRLGKFATASSDKTTACDGEADCSTAPVSAPVQRLNFAAMSREYMKAPILLLSCRYGTWLVFRSIGSWQWICNFATLHDCCVCHCGRWTGLVGDNFWNRMASSIDSGSGLDLTHAYYMRQNCFGPFGLVK